jgi:hypothetical protein
MQLAALGGAAPARRERSPAPRARVRFARCQPVEGSSRLCGWPKLGKVTRCRGTKGWAHITLLSGRAPQAYPSQRRHEREQKSNTPPRSGLIRSPSAYDLCGWRAPPRRPARLPRRRHSTRSARFGDWTRRRRGNGVLVVGIVVGARIGGVPPAATRAAARARTMASPTTRVESTRDLEDLRAVRPACSGSSRLRPARLNTTSAPRSRAFPTGRACALRHCAARATARRGARRRVRGRAPTTSVAVAVWRPRASSVPTLPGAGRAMTMCMRATDSLRCTRPPGAASGVGTS